MFHRNLGGGNPESTNKHTQFGQLIITKSLKLFS